MAQRASDHPEQVSDQRRPAVAPAVDIFEGKDELLLFADMPGVSREDVSIHIDKGELTLFAKRQFPAAGAAGAAGAASAASERASFDYRRTFALQGVDAERVEAELSAGVLKLRLPKSSAPRPRQISVKAG